MGVSGALADEVLQEGGQQLEAVALLHLIHKPVNGQQRPDGQDEVGDEVVGGLAVQQRTHHLGGLGGADLLHVPLNVAQHVVVVQVGGQVTDHVKPVAHIDEGAGIRQLGLLQEVLDTLGGVHVGFAGHALHLLDLAGASCCLNVLVVLLGVLRGCDAASQVEVQPRPAVVSLQQLHDLEAAQLVGVLPRNVDHQLQILLGVGHQQLLQALQGPLLGQGAKVLHQSLLVDGMCVGKGALDVWQVTVVLQGPHVQAGLLTQLGDAGPVVVGQGAVCQDGISNLWVGHQVDLQQLGLQHGLLWAVTRQGIQQECSGLAHHVALQEQVRHCVHLQLGWSLLHRHLGQCYCALRAVHHQGLQQVHVVQLLTSLPSVGHQSIEIALLSQSPDDLATCIAALVDLERHVLIACCADHVAQLL
mmetsp:Transcript_17299/g.37319  ORF Transcript_17299/g.37319 Transcript_17299/m.37319 type:complete len:416 (+) Transcript_17299:2809-4056(+)